MNIKVPLTHLALDTWSLPRGQLVVAVRLLDQDVANVRPGTVGVVFEVTDAYKDRGGPMVRWETGAACNVYPGDVALAEGGRPALAEVVQVALLEDKGLRHSTCGCCADKRQLLDKLKTADVIE